jgi:DNA-binding NtrC family response regulator
MAKDRLVVYVVDDERIIAETLAMILNQAGFTSYAFQDARRALHAAAAGPPPNLLISDVVMPEMSGIELAIEFQQIYPACKILLFSGQATTANLLAAARGQGHHFEVLAKPIHPADLLARVRIFDGNADQEMKTTGRAPARGRQP